MHAVKLAIASCPRGRMESEQQGRVFVALFPQARSPVSYRWVKTVLYMKDLFCSVWYSKLCARCWTTFPVWSDRTWPIFIVFLETRTENNQKLYTLFPYSNNIYTQFPLFPMGSETPQRPLFPLFRPKFMGSECEIIPHYKVYDSGP